MSKKRIRSRLDNLFSDLAATGKPSSEPESEVNGADLFAIEPQNGSSGGQAQVDVEQSTFEQLIQAAKPTLAPLPNPDPLASAVSNVSQSFMPAARTGYALEEGAIHKASRVWTEVGKKSLADHETALTNASSQTPAAIAVPMQTQGVGDFLLEIVDDSDHPRVDRR
jgi:hypothetical protein